MFFIKARADLECFQVNTIVERLSLSKKLNLYSGSLSGGEQKRLTIALELVDDPLILFLDEPTTGLDSSSSTQCIQLLKQLAQEGRTIVCTVHTPSAFLLEMFDHIYTLAKGRCIYQGSSNNLVPFLSDLGLKCPETFTPSDFLLEIANDDYGIHNDRLTEKIQNGNNSYRDLIDQKPSLSITTVTKSLFKANIKSPQFANEFNLLLIRNFMIIKRDKSLSQIRLTIHFVIAAFIGCIFNGIGQDASNIFNIYKLLFFNIFLLMFTAFSSLQTSCKFFNLFITKVKSQIEILFLFTVPLNLPTIKREHFNGWYSTSSYYLALTISDIPLIISTSLIYIAITYFMTNQPLEFNRFCAYYIVILLLSITSQGLGLIAGSLLNVKFTLILGSFFICPFVLFSNFFIHMKDTDPLWHWIFDISFIKHALEGSMQAIFGFNRDKMSCDVPYCHYRWPYRFMEAVGITDSYSNVILKLITFAFIFRIIAFIIMWYRLRH